METMKLDVGDNVLIFNSLLRTMVHGVIIHEELNYYDVELTNSMRGKHTFHFEKTKLRGMREGQHLQITGKVK